MVKWILALALAAFTPAISQAATFTVGDAAPVTVDIPDSWGPKEYDGGVEAQSEAGTYVTVEGMAAQEMQAAVDNSISDIAKQGLTIDPASQATQDGMTINGMACAAFAFDGAYEGKVNAVMMFFCAVDDKNMAILTSWFDKESDKADGKEFQTILDSLKPAK